MKSFHSLLSVLLFSLLIAQQVHAVPLAGNYTVGGVSPDYATIQAAVNDLHSNGISAPVEFRLRDGTYNDQVTITDFPRTGAVDDRVTFRRQEALGTVTWHYTSQGSANNWVVKLDGAHHITIRGMNFNAASAGYYDIVHIEGGASDNIIELCDFTGVFTNGTHILQSGLGNHPNHTFRNNTFTYGDIGIDFDYAFGGADSDGLVITDNTFTGQNSGAVETGSQDAVLTGNSVFATTISGTGFIGFDIQDNGPVIENNRMDIVKGVAGIWVFAIGGLAVEGRIVNNLVALRTTSGTRGIFSATDNISIYHNTVRSASTNGYPLWIDSQSADVRIHNNILINDATVGGIALRIDDTAAIASSDHNNIYSTGSLVVKSNNNDYNTVDGYSLASGLDANSTSQSVSFVSTAGTNDLHLTAPSNNDVDLLSPTLISVDADFDGDVRGQLTTYKGADEGIPYLPLDNADTVGGFYTVGGVSPDYSNPNLAIIDLKQRGMKGPVTFRVRAGSYNVNRTLSGIVRSGDAGDQVLFRASNMNAPPTFQHAATSSADNWIIRIQNEHRIAFNFINFTATGGGQYGHLIDLDGDSSDISVRNAVLSGLSGQTDKSAALIFSDDTGRTNLLFNNNTFVNGSYGLYLTTANPFTLPNGEALTITANEFNQQVVNALLTNYDDLTFSSNEVYSSSNDMTAVYVEFNKNVQLHKNRFLLTGTDTTAVVLEGADGRTLANPSVLSNNFVVAATGFELNTGAGSIDMFFNSISASTVPVNIGFNAAPNGSSDLQLRNNILSNTGSGAALSVASGVSFEDSNYNNFINTSGVLIDWQGASYLNVVDFNAATGFGQGSVSTPVQFVDENNADLHLSGASIGDLSLGGTFIDSILDDYDGESRSVYSPYMGADEAAIMLINEIFIDSFE